jgi:hypothetical protein
MGWLSQRIEVVRRVLDRRWVKIALGLWPVLASYDLFVSQLLPERWADRAPKMRDILAETSGWLPWWGWVLILMGILIVALFEYAVWRTHQHKRIVVGAEIKPRQKSEAAIPIDPRWSRDLPLLEALWRVYNGNWNGRVDLSQEHYQDAKVLKLWDAASSIRQHAFDGTLPIWARRQNSKLYEPVPTEFWRNHDIDVSLNIHSTSTDTWVYVTHQLVIGEVRFSMAKEWEGFMTCKEAVEGLWPLKVGKSPR